MGKPDKNIVTYVYTYLQQGYEISSIKESLLNQGYKQKQINSAIDFVYANYYYQNNPNPVKKQTTFQNSTKTKKYLGVGEVAIFILILFGVSIVGMSLVFILSSPDEIPSDESINQGREIILENNGNEIKNEKEDTRREDSIKLIEENHESSTDKEHTLEVIEKNNAVQESVSEKFDNLKVYSQRQLEIKAEFFAEESPEEGMKFCDAMYNDVSRQYCYIDIAKISGVEAYCEEITLENAKDDCYREIVFESEGDAQTCDKIENAYKKDGCLDYLRAISTYESLKNKELENNPEDAINYYDYVEADFYEAQ